MIHIADARIDIRLRIDFQKMRDHELGSPEINEPVGDDGDAGMLFLSFQSSTAKDYISSFP